MLVSTIKAFIGRKEDTTIEAIYNIGVTIDSMCIFFVKILDSKAKGIGN